MWLLVIRRIFGQIHQIRSIRCHAVDFPVSVPVGLEGYQAAIRRPLQRSIVPWVIGQVRSTAPIHINHEDI